MFKIAIHGYVHICILALVHLHDIRPAQSRQQENLCLFLLLSVGCMDLVTVADMSSLILLFIKITSLL